MKKLRIAQIGIGHDHAMEILRSIRQQTELFEVVGYALPEIEKEKFADRMKQPCCQGLPLMTVEEILNDPTIEAVTVETLTPIEALNFLYELKKTLKGSISG